VHGPSSTGSLLILDLLQAPVVLFVLPTRLDKFQPSHFIHLLVVGSPGLRRTFLRNDPKHFHHAIVLKMDYFAGCRSLAIPNPLSSSQAGLILLLGWSLVSHRHSTVSIFLKFTRLLDQPCKKHVFSLELRSLAVSIKSLK